MSSRINDHIRKRLLHGVVERVPDIPSLRRSEVSTKFEEFRMNRKIIGAFRYGLMGKAGKPKYDRVSCMIDRLKKYQTDRNAEHLVDVANLAELEFVEGDHIGVVAQDDTEHTKEL